MNEIPMSAFVRARLSLKGTEEGGRSRPIATGYRPSFWLGAIVNGERAYSDAAVYLEGIEQLEPGETAVVRLRPSLPDDWRDIEVGSEIELCEGRRVLGVATVVELFPAPSS